MEHLKLLREILPLEKSLSEVEKLALWSIAMLAFFGSFRITELLPKKARTIYPKVDLLRRDIKLVCHRVGNVQKRFLKIHLKSPKETSG